MVSKRMPGHTERMPAAKIPLPRRERRSDARYPVSSDIEYRVLRNGVPTRYRSGTLLNLSRKGVLLQSDSLPTGVGDIEIRSAWPGSGGARPRLWVEILARIVRNDPGRRVAARILRYRFVPAGRAVPRFTHTLQAGARN